MKKIYISKEVVPGIFGKIGMGAVTILFFVAAYKLGWYFLLFVPLPILAITSYRGVEIDLSNQEYALFSSVIGIKSREKFRMPDIRYVVIIDALFVKESRRRYGTVVTDEMYEVALICEEHVKIPLLYSYDIPEILAFAVQEKQTYHCHIEDLTKELIAKDVNKA